MKKIIDRRFEEDQNGRILEIIHYEYDPKSTEPQPLMVIKKRQDFDPLENVKVEEPTKDLLKNIFKGKEE